MHINPSWLSSLGIVDAKQFAPQHSWASAPGGGRLVVPVGLLHAPVSVGAPRSKTARVFASVRTKLFGAPPSRPRRAVTLDLARYPVGVIHVGDGAGATSLLRHMITALCARYGPDRVSLVLSDCRSSVTFSGIADFPHVRAHRAGLHDSGTPIGTLLADVRKEATRRRRLSAENLAKQPQLVVVLNDADSVDWTQAKLLKDLEAAFQPGRDLRMSLLLVSQTPVTQLSALVRSAGFAVVLGSASPQVTIPLLGTGAASISPRFGRGLLRVGKLGGVAVADSFDEFSASPDVAALIPIIAAA